MNPKMIQYRQGIAAAAVVAGVILVAGATAQIRAPGAQPPSPPGPPPAASPFRGEFVEAARRLLEEEREALRDLGLRLAATAGNEERRELERQIEARKRNTHLEILRLQAALARREGKDEVALRIEELLRAVTAEPRPVTPAPKPPRDGR